MDNKTNGKGRLHRVGTFLGLIEEPSEQRSVTAFETQGFAAVPSRSDSTYVSGNQAMGLVGVYRAVSIISTAVKQLPVNVYRGGVEIDPSPLIRQPNIEISRAAFLEQTVTSMALTGNAYWLLNRQTPADAVTNIEVLNPHLCQIVIDEKTGKPKEYTYGDKTYPAWKIKHLRLLRVPGSHNGLGPVQAAQASLRGAVDLRDYATNWFRDGGAPNGILKSDNVMSPDERLMYQETWDTNNRTGKVRVLGHGLSYQPIYLSPKDAQFIESQAFTKTEVATLFGIPAVYMLADGGNSMTYTNSIQADIAFVRYTLSQYVTEIEQAFSELIPRGQDARLVVEGLLRADQKTRFEGYALADFMTVNEKRAIEGLPPIDGGNELAKPASPAPTVPNEGGQQ